MQFKSLVLATLLIGLAFAAEPQEVLAAEPQDVLAAEPQVVLATEPEAAPAAIPQAASTADGQVAADGIIGSIIWPVGFTDQCNALYKISQDLDKQLALAKAKNKWSCTADQNMLFKPTIIAALLIGLSLAAPHPDLAAESQDAVVVVAEPQDAVVVVAEPQAIIATEPQASTDLGPQAFDPSDLSIIGDVAWPAAFYRQCNTLAAITASFDKQLDRAYAKGYSCTPAQAAAIAKTSTCPPFNILLT
ncbi:hypothetical protein BGZ97_002649, partial [Linnemannia gamsii]